MMTYSLPPALRLAASALAVALCAALASCTPSPTQLEETPYLDLSLAETKSSSQLLRNETAGRVPSEVISDVRENLDRSSPCLDVKDDPNGLVRYWTSGAELALVIFPGDSVRDIVDDVASSYVDEGWLLNTVSSRMPTSDGGQDDATVYSAVLTRGSSSAAITVGAVEPDVGASWISIEVHGPCVMTEGAESDDVLALEQPA